MKHGRDCLPDCGQDFAEPPMRITLMQKERHLQFLGERNMRLEPVLLRRPRREIPIESSPHSPIATTALCVASRHSSEIVSGVQFRLSCG